MKVGITGDMGSGKSHCCSLFASLGIPVFLTDTSAKRMMNENDAVKYMLRKMISPDIYNEDGTVNREVMQNKLFECPEAEANRGALNIALYSYVEEDYNRFLEENKMSPYTVCESALMFESNWFEKFDYIIFVYAPDDVRVERVIKRSGLTPEQQHARMKNQINPKLKMRASDFVINNYGYYDVVKQVDDINDELIKKVFADL